MRYPDGSFHPLGEGSIPTATDTDGYENGYIDDPDASIDWISPSGSHRIFEADVPLTPGAPLTSQLYDRTAMDLKLLTFLPGEIPPVGFSRFAGSSENGFMVLFENEGNLYVRIGSSKTVELASSGDGVFVPAGVDAAGTRAFYVQEGAIFYYDVETEATEELASTSDGSVVYVSPDGSHVYFLSEEELITGEGATGAPNLYVWDEASIKFIGTLTAEDLAHSENFGGEPFAGLKYWSEKEPLPGGIVPVPVARNQNFLAATARSTYDGKVFVFESQASLTGYPNEGHTEIFRYEPETEEFDCVSCSPVEPAASADSRLVFLQKEGALSSVNSTQEIANLSADGSSVVFESRQGLLPADGNGVRDVYQWKEGALSLISTGHSSLATSIAGLSANGSDIFMRTAEKLVTQGQDSGTYAIYDARVDGGLSSQQEGPSAECQAEGCLKMPAAPPELVAPGSAQLHGKGNVRGRCHGRRKGERHKHSQAKRRQVKKKSCSSNRRRAGK